MKNSSLKVTLEKLLNHLFPTVFCLGIFLSLNLSDITTGSGTLLKFATIRCCAGISGSSRTEITEICSSNNYDALLGT